MGFFSTINCSSQLRNKSGTRQLLWIYQIKYTDHTRNEWRGHNGFHWRKKEIIEIMLKKGEGDWIEFRLPIYPIHPRPPPPDYDAKARSHRNDCVANIDLNAYTISPKRTNRSNLNSSRISIAPAHYQLINSCLPRIGRPPSHCLPLARRTFEIITTCNQAFNTAINNSQWSL